MRRDTWRSLGRQQRIKSVEVSVKFYVTRRHLFVDVFHKNEIYFLLNNLIHLTIKWSAILDIFNTTCSRENSSMQPVRMLYTWMGNLYFVRCRDARPALQRRQAISISQHIQCFTTNIKVPIKVQIMSILSIKIVKTYIYGH